jgi:hypothetical protein
MTPKENEENSISKAEQELAISSLEREQLAGLKKPVILRRHLGRWTKFVLWSLRIYLLFMMAVVLYQVWVAAH